METFGVHQPKSKGQTTQKTEILKGVTLSITVLKLGTVKLCHRTIVHINTSNFHEEPYVKKHVV